VTAFWEPCRALVGSQELSLFSDKLNMKRPGGAPFPWHQESPYWVYGAEQVERIVSVLVYLDDASIDNGCLWVIPGSHRHGVLPALSDRGVLGALYTDVGRVEGEPFPVQLPPARRSGSTATSSTARRAIAARTIAASSWRPISRPDCVVGVSTECARSEPARPRAEPLVCSACSPRADSRSACSSLAFWRPGLGGVAAAEARPSSARFAAT
jgi:hypothetical protein